MNKRLLWAVDRRLDWIDDADETEGRRLYRRRADALVRAQLAYAQRTITLRPAMPDGIERQALREGRPLPRFDPDRRR